MSRYFLVLFILSTLASCTLGQSETPVTPVSSSPVYPSQPMDASGQVTPAPTTGQSFDLSGSGWTAQITPAATTITTLSGSTSYESRQASEGSVTRVTGLKGEVFVTITPENCTTPPDMTVYPYVVTVLQTSETMTGCAMNPPAAQ